MPNPTSVRATQRAQSVKKNLKTVKPKRKKSKSEKVFDIYVTVLILALVFGVITTIGLFPSHFITVSTVLKMVIISGLFTAGLCLFYAVKKDEKGKSLLSELGIPFYLLLNVFCGGAFFTSLILLFNFVGRGDTRTEVYEFGKRDPNYKAGSYSGVVYQLKNYPYENEVDYRWFAIKHIGPISNGALLQMDISEGAFGIDVFEQRGFVSDSTGANFKTVELLGDGY